MASQTSCMTVGQGDVYSYFNADCIDAIKVALLDPSSEIAEFLVDWSGMDIEAINAALGTLLHCPEYGVYIDPDPESTSWDLMGGEYSDLAEALAVAGEEFASLDCNLQGGTIGPGAITILNSHQGSAGF